MPVPPGFFEVTRILPTGEPNVPELVSLNHLVEVRPHNGNTGCELVLTRGIVHVMEPYAIVAARVTAARDALS
jgi:hypothetical protein